MPWNPTDPTVVGPEFIAELTRSWTVGSTGGATSAVSQRFRSTVAEADPDLQVYATAVTGSGFMVAEVMEDDQSPLLTNIALAQVQPDGLTNVINFKTNAGSTVVANLLNAIDDVGDPANGGDYVAPVSTPGGQAMDVRFDVAQLAAAVTGKRILGLSVGIHAQPQDANDKTDQYGVVLIDTVAGEIIANLTRLVSANRENWFAMGEVYQHADDHSDNQLWTASKVQELGVGGDLAIRIFTFGESLRFSRVRLVIATADENRVATALFSQREWSLTATERGSEPGVWSDPVPLMEPDGTSGWNKADDTTYRVWYRRAYTGDLVNTLNVTLPVLSRHDSADLPAATYLDAPLLLGASAVSGPSAASYRGTQAVAPGVSASALRTPVGAAWEPRGLIPVRLLVGGADSVDGQPYTRVMPLQLAGTTDPVVQLVSTGAGGTYTGLRLAAGLASNVDPSDVLTVLVKNAAGTVTLGTGTMSASAFKARANYLTPGLMVEAVVELEVTLAAATQYQVVVQSSTGADRAWLVGVYTSRGGGGQEADWPDGAAGYGGDTDYASGHASISFPVLGDDLDGHLLLALTGPTDLTATAQLLDFNQAEPGGVDGIPYARLDWVKSSVGADFARYRLQRRDSVDADWVDVAYFVDERVRDFLDVETRLQVPNTWRLRVEGLDGQVSLWLDADQAVTLESTGCGYTFSSNWVPLQSVAYADSHSGDAVRDYGFPDAGEAQVRRFAGRDDFVVFRPTEKRSVRFQRRLLVRAFNGGDGIVGPAAFDQLRDLSRGDLGPIPYLAVRDEEGNRWYAAVLVGEGTVQQPGEHHRAAVEVIPVARVPVAPTVEG